MKKDLKPDFPFKNKDVLSFPDQYSEYVDVGIGMMKVAETPYDNLVIVRKHGRGFRLQLEYESSEVFSFRKNKKFISLVEYLNYFGDYSDLKWECREEDLNEP